MSSGDSLTNASRSSAPRRDPEGARLADLSRAVRESTLKRLRLVPPGAESWRPSAAALSIGDIAHHLVRSDEWLFAKLADPGLHGMVAVAGEAGEVARAELERLVARLEELGRARAVLLAGLDDEELSELWVDDRFGGEVTVWWSIVRGNLDHEAHHRGQLATYLRILKDGEIGTR